MTKAKRLIMLVIILLASVLSAAGGTPEALKVGFIYVGPVGDYGWSYAHDQGRKYLEANLPAVKTTYVESVPEGADAERVLTQLARSGHAEPMVLALIPMPENLPLRSTWHPLSGTGDRITWRR